MGYRVVTPEEKAEAIRLVVEMHYSVPKACEATGVGLTALRRWVARWRRQQNEVTQLPRLQDQELIESLQAKLALLEAENQVLKKQLPSHLKVLFGRTK
ncbi:MULTISPECIES: IS3 family transposase [Pseudomonas fluorescens group]|jgi:transposase|uniref:IS3 family transposase n=1 Tax=Pseudomonas fluorescens group TaxID=136843 RepID=UPI00087DE171|nr:MULTISPECIES: IS3 family transposase [Pseudomonas fluorescens group]SDU03414.1 transposase [Pseudomonas moraviensis]SDU68178.1 transposase [Pseudomonas moraviensis]